MKILILGATGFMGRNCAEYFAAKGHEIHGIINRRSSWEGNITWHPEIDLTSKDDVGQIFEIVKPDVVIQAAAATSGCKDTLEKPYLHTAPNAIMNSLIFPAAIEAGVKHVIFPSCSVMYQSSDTPLKETDLDFNVPLNPAYLGFASTKLYCEKLCEFYASISDTKFTVFRNTNFYGPYDKYDPVKSHVFGATIAKVMNATDKVTVWGTGEEARDFIHISEFCRAAELAIENQKNKFALYNIGLGKATKIRDLVAKIIFTSKKKLNIAYDTSAPTIPTAFSLNCEKVREELGWEPTIDLDRGVAMTIDWYKENVAGTSASANGD